MARGERCAPKGRRGEGVLGVVEGGGGGGDAESGAGRGMRL